MAMLWPSERQKPSLLVLDQNTITIDAADRLGWNGTTVSADALRAQVAAAAELTTPAILRFAPDKHASYNTAARTIALIREDGAYLYTLPSVVDDIDLGITQRTVEFHRANIFEKMGVSSAIELAHKLGRLQPIVKPQA